MATQTVDHNGHCVSIYIGGADFAEEVQRRRKSYGVADEMRDDMSYLLAAAEGSIIRYTFGTPAPGRSFDYLEECLFRPFKGRNVAVKMP